MGIGHTHNLRLWVARRHIQAERTPATAQLQYVLSVLQLGALAAQLQHICFGLRERYRATFPVATAVFEVGTQYLGKKGGRNFVVLLIGHIGGHGQRSLAEGFKEGCFTCLGNGRAPCRQTLEMLLIIPVHALTHGPVGEAVIFEKTVIPHMRHFSGKPLFAARLDTRFGAKRYKMEK